MSTLSNIKRNLSLWSKIILLFKAYWYIILDIDELPNRISNIFGKSPSKEKQKLLTSNDFTNASDRVIEDIKKQPVFKEYPKKTIDAGIYLGKVLFYKQISGSSFEVGKGYSSSYTEQREMSSWNKQ